MGVISGIGGVVNGKDSIRTWSVDASAELQAYVASNTKGGSSRVVGNTDWSGQYSAYGHSPSSLPGEALTFIGSIDGAKGVKGVAVVDSVEITIDIEAGAIISHVVNFSANGVLDKADATASSDATVPDPPSAIGCKVEKSDALVTPSFSNIDNVRTVTLSIEADNQSYVSSDTAGGTKRVAGNVDFNVSIVVYVDDFNDLIDENAIKHLRVYVDATTYWDLKWVMFGEASGLEVDREGATPVGATMNAHMEGFTDVEGTPTEGQIAEPDSTVFWPAV